MPVFPIGFLISWSTFSNTQSMENPDEPILTLSTLSLVMSIPVINQVFTDK